MLTARLLSKARCAQLRPLLQARVTMPPIRSLNSKTPSGNPAGAIPSSPKPMKPSPNDAPKNSSGPSGSNGGSNGQGKKKGGLLWPVALLSGGLIGFMGLLHSNEKFRAYITEHFPFIITAISKVVPHVQAPTKLEDVDVTAELEQLKAKRDAASKTATLNKKKKKQKKASKKPQPSTNDDTKSVQEALRLALQLSDAEKAAEIAALLPQVERMLAQQAAERTEPQAKEQDALTEFFESEQKHADDLKEESLSEARLISQQHYVKLLEQNYSQLLTNIDTVLEELVSANIPSAESKLVERNLEIQKRTPTSFDTLNDANQHIVHLEEELYMLAELETSRLQQLHQQFHNIVKEQVSEAYNAKVTEWKTELDTVIDDMYNMLEKRKHQELEETRKRAVEVVERIHAELKHQKEEEVANLTMKLQQQYTLECNDRLNELHLLQQRIQGFNSVLDWQNEYIVTSYKVNRMSAAVLAMDELLEKSCSLRAEWDAVEVAGRGDLLVDSVIRSVPSEVVANGAASLQELQQRYNRVEKAAREATLVPESKSIWGFILAKITNSLMMQQRGLSQGDDDQAKLARCGYFVNNGDFLSAIRELEQMSELPRTLCSDWIREVRHRLILEQAIDTLKAYMNILPLQYKDDAAGR